MKDTYDAVTVDEVEKYKLEMVRKDRLRARNGMVAMAAFAPLWSAADPKSRLYQFNRFAPMLFFAILIVFAGLGVIGVI